MIVLDKSNFYPESGGQVADKGALVSQSNSLSVQIDHVLTFQGFTFHSGKVLASNADSTLKINDQVSCEIDSKSRFYTSLNHSAVHLLNHSIRRLFNNESCVLQTGSQVSPSSFKLEFKFNEILVEKLTPSDLTKIQSFCNELIEKKLAIYLTENVNLESVAENKSSKYPVRMLNDVLYPVKVRVVSVGEKIENFNKGSVKF